MIRIPSDSPLLSATDLSVGYADRIVLGPLNLILRPGEVIALLGSNGAGKSTLLKTLSHELRPVSGDISVCGTSIRNIPRRKLAAMQSIVTTERIAAGALTVRELVAIGRHPHTGMLGRLSKEDHNIVEKAIDEVGIRHKADSFVAELSDGERQKTMIAKALAQEAPIMLLDEPFSFLDTASRIEIFSLLLHIAETRRIGVILSSHDVAQALRMAHKIWLVTADGKLVDGSPAELKQTKAVADMFKSRSVAFDPLQNDFIAADQSPIHS